MIEVFLFELRYRLKRPATWIYISLGILMAGFWAALSSSSTAEFTNSSNNIAELIGPISIISIFFYAAIMGVPIFRDQDHKTAQTYFTFPIKQKSYVLGRFLGSFSIVTLLNLFIVLGAMIGFGIGEYMDRPDYGEYDTFNLSSYILPFIFLLQINALLIGSLFFCLMAFFKKMPIIYLGGICLFLLYDLSGDLLGSLENQWLSVYLDPFGGRAFSFVKKYWSVNELNTNQLPIYGKFLVNRMLWLGVGLFLLLLTYFRFDYKKFLLSGKKGKKTNNDEYQPSLISSITQVFTKKTERNNLLSLSKIEFLSIIKDPVFIILLIIGIIISLITIFNANETYGTPNIPLTRYVVTFISGGITLLSIIILVIYSGEAVHRTRKNKTFVFYDALPISNSSLYFSKIISLIATAIVLTLTNIVIGILFQTFNGYFQYELGTYLIYNFALIFPSFLTTILLSFFIHVLVNNKFLGYFIIILAYIGLPLLVTLAFKSNNPLLIYGGSTPFFLSDLNGFGHYLAGLTWVNLYWILMTAILMVVGKLFWTRGFFATAKERLSLAKQRFNGRTIAALSIVIIAFISVASYSYYNLKVLNKIETGDYYEKTDADAEKKYAKYINQAHPQVTDLKAYIDVYPEERNVNAKGEFKLINNYDTPIDTLLLEVQYPTADTQLKKVVYNGKELEPVVTDSVYRMYFYKLPEALLPNERANLTIDVSATTKGFANQRETEVLNNGSFLNNSIFPRFHYDRSLSDNGVRKKHGLEELDYLYPPRTDSTALKKNLFNEDANYINFEAVLSTANDQIALAPGKLVKEWKENDRAYYHYKLESQTDLFFNVVSARYNVEKSSWTAPSGKKVDIEIYHAPSHNRNLEYFIEGTKVALEYCSKNFYEYPNSVIRIVEFPAHSTFAQSFVTTIPYSEDFGFAADFDRAEDFNYAFRVTAHEVAHQWWGHLVTPSKTSGANIISETLAEYSSLMTMKHQYGENGIKNFLKYSLDAYLRSRAFSFKPERSLINVETGGYIWYRKGSMVMYELQDIIGENKINTALKNFTNEYKNFEKGVYPTSENLYDALYTVAPDSLKYAVEDGFKEIVLYENRVVSAKTKELDNGKFETSFTVDSKKIYYDDKGKEERTDDKTNYIEIGLFGEDIVDDQEVPLKNPFYLERKWLKSGENTFTVITDKKPVKAGIDPYNKLIDRNSDDNLKNIEE
ncbi:ABC transporter permease/M1 family aminopeptidase [Aquimarina sp. 2201CG5-10]|uniref:ABC transporter permease/M1 family aminopeptidase n=1 Tax=Aquimarina callyspongiae TaxID=3098150 RepID=UPI002AB3E229|nr:M1 family aminopeptidase [Aquimarina sp. 2201CG5-10]MDY8137133.1 M1 family aminopeptidase [Aquimarina sp. 2201CG5-10]